MFHSEMGSIHLKFITFLINFHGEQSYIAAVFYNARSAGPVGLSAV